MKNNITQKTQRTERISSESSNFKLIQNEKEEAFQNFLQSSNSTKKCPDYSSDKVLLTYPDTTRNSSAIGKASDDENEEKIIKQIFSVDIKTQKSENFIEFLDSYISYFDEKRSKKNSESIFNGEKKKIKDESSKYKEKIDAAKIIQKKNQREIEIFKIKEKCYIKKIEDLEQQVESLVKDNADLNNKLYHTQELLAREKIDNQNSLFALHKVISKEVVKERKKTQNKKIKNEGISESDLSSETESSLEQDLLTTLVNMKKKKGSLDFPVTSKRSEINSNSNITRGSLHFTSKLSDIKKNFNF